VHPARCCGTAGVLRLLIAPFVLLRLLTSSFLHDGVIIDSLTLSTSACLAVVALVSAPPHRLCAVNCFMSLAGSVLTSWLTLAVRPAATEHCASGKWYGSVCLAGGSIR
jgi:hypothetical protein